MKRIAGPLLAAVLFAAGCQSQPFHSSLSDKQSIFDKKSPTKADGNSLAKRAKPGHGDASKNADHHRIAVLNDQKKNYGEAERHYHLALQEDRNDPNLLCDYGYSKLLQGQYAESEQLLRQAIAIDPDHKKSLYNLGYLYAKRGDARRAYSYFCKAGSEERARSLMASLFPKGYDGTILPASKRSAQSPGQSTLRAPAPGTPGYKEYLSGLSFDEVKELARRRREESQAQRQQKPYSGSGGASPWQDSQHDTSYGNRSGQSSTRNDGFSRNDRYARFGSNGADRRSYSPQLPDRQPRGGIIPDHELSNKMREIDREYEDRTYSNYPYGNKQFTGNSGRRSVPATYPPERGIGNQRKSGYDRRYDDRMNGGSGNRTAPQQSSPSRLLFPPEDTDNTNLGNNGAGVDVHAISRRRYVPERERYPAYGTGNDAGTPSRFKPAPYGSNATETKSYREALRLGHNAGTGAPFPMTSKSTSTPMNRTSGTNANHADYTGGMPPNREAAIRRSGLDRAGSSTGYQSRYGQRGTANLTPPPSSGYGQQNRDAGNGAYSDNQYGQAGKGYQNRDAGSNDRRYLDGPAIIPRNTGRQSSPTAYGSPQYPSDNRGARY